MDESRTPRLTYRVELPGGIGRLEDAALYVMEKCVDADAFGLTKLNKILWRADFRAYAERRLPVTGRQYQRLPQGPVPVEMPIVIDNLLSVGAMRIDDRPVISFVERRPIALQRPALRFFSPDDLSFLDASVEHYWSLSGRRTSADSHGIAWSTRANGEPMPYELSLLLDEKLPEADLMRLASLGREHGWRSA